jgi:hypothetical protein
MRTAELMSDKSCFFGPASKAMNPNKTAVFCGT